MTVVSRPTLACTVLLLSSALAQAQWQGFPNAPGQSVWGGGVAQPAPVPYPTPAQAMAGNPLAGNFAPQSMGGNGFAPDRQYPVMQPAALGDESLPYGDTFSSRAFRVPNTCMGISLGVLGLVREVPDSQVLAVDENYDPILNAREMQGSMQFGFDAQVDFYNLNRALGGTDLQLGYFGINSLDAEEAIVAGEVNSIFFNAVPLDPPATSIFLYSTNLYSGEANLRFMSNSRIRPIVGLRFFKLEDQYDVYEYSNGVRLGGFSKTNNHMFGGQYGAEADVMRLGCARWYANGKFGTLYNQVDGATRAADSTGTGVEKYYGDRHFSTLVDAGTGLDFGFAGPLSFRVGYRFLMASGLATGMDQNESIHLLSPGQTVVFGSQQWHGINLAANFVF